MWISNKNETEMHSETVPDFSKQALEFFLMDSEISLQCEVVFPTIFSYDMSHRPSNSHQPEVAVIHASNTSQRWDSSGSFGKLVLCCSVLTKEEKVNKIS